MKLLSKPGFQVLSLFLSVTAFPALAHAGAGHICIVYTVSSSSSDSDLTTSVTCDGKPIKTVKGVDNATVSAVLEGVVSQGFRVVGATENQFSKYQAFSSQTWTLEKD
jgi:hypothetical protein